MRWCADPEEGGYIVFDADSIGVGVGVGVGVSVRFFVSVHFFLNQ